MLRRIWIRLSGIRSRKNTLKDILSESYNREGFLGVRRDAPPTFERIVQDNDKVVNYARTQDYSVFAQELWSHVINSIDKLADPNTDPSQVDFYRGSLAESLESLRISYKALFNKQDAKEKSARQ